VTGQDRDKVQAAKEHISGIVQSAVVSETPRYEIGGHYTGRIKRVVDYGLFVEMPGGNDALLHVSKIAPERMENLAERYREGEEIEVIVLDQKGRKVELATPEYYQAKEGENH